MGILKKLFGKKKEEVKTEQPQPKEKPQAENKDVSLQDVNDELKNLKSIEEDKEIKKQEVPSKTETETLETKKPKAEPKPKAEEKPKAEAKAEPKERKDVYHVKKHDEGWQLIKEGAQKAYRVFKYQKEAIDFAKEENLEYIVFKADGTKRDL